MDWTLCLAGGTAAFLCIYLVVALLRVDLAARIIVARLSNRTGSHYCLSIGLQFVTLSNLWLNEFPFRLVVLFKNALNVRVSADADSGKLLRDSV